MQMFKSIFKSITPLFLSLLLTYIVFSFIANNWLLFPIGILRNFLGMNYFSQQVTSMTILIFIALAISITSRTGIIDISTPGKLLLGGLTIYITVYFFNGAFWSIFLGIIIAYLLLAGLSYFMIFLKFKFNVNEVIFGIMINWIIFFIYNSLTAKDLPWISRSSAINYSNMLNFGINTLQYMSWFIFIAIFAIGFIFVFYKWTSMGHQIKIIGNSRSVSKTVGIKIKKISFISITISSLLVALASAVYIFSKNGGAIPISIKYTPSEGWTALAISSVSFGNPIAILLNSFIFSSIETSKSFITSFSTIDSNVLNIVVGILMVVISIMPYLIKNSKRWSSKIFYPLKGMWPIIKIRKVKKW